MKKELFMMGTRHLSLLEQKKMQWAKEKEEMAGLCTPWGPPERSRPLRKRLAPNLPEDPNENLNIRNDENLQQVPVPYESPVNVQSINMQYAPVRGRTPQRVRNDIHSQSPSLPPVNQNAPDDPRRDGLDNYLYVNDSHGLSKSTENFSVSESDIRAKRKVFLSGDHAGRSGSYEKFSAERSPYSSSYQFGNSNLSLATEGDTTWREWAMGRGGGDDPRPRWGDRGINTGGHPWNPGGPTPMGRNADNLGPNEEYPTPGWVERGLSRMSGDGRGRGGSAESLRGDPGVRVIVSDETNGNQRQRNSLGELQNVPYGPVSGANEMYPSRNFDGHSSAIPYVGEMPSMHSSAGMYNRGGGSVIEGNRGERVIVIGRDVYNAGEVVNSGRPYGHNSCISAPSNKPPIPRYKKNEEMTSSLPNLQSTNTHLRGQNVPVDPDVVMEREMRRLKAIELQKAIRQQLEDREKRRLQEKEQRLKEERQIEERLRQQQEAERAKREEEERKLREKEEMENKKAEIMREALEAAEHDAQKQRKKRSAHLIEKVPQVEPNKGHDDAVSAMDPDESTSNYIISSCYPVIAEGTPNPVVVRQQERQEAPNDVDRVTSAHLKLDRSVAPGERDHLDYEQTSYHSSTNPVAPFKISLPETSMVGGHFEGGDSADNRQGGVLIVGRDVYLLPYVNTDILAPRHINNSTYSFGAVGGIEDMGNRILASGDQCDLGREWIGGSHRVRPSKDATTQTEPSTQGPLLLLLRVAGPDDSQTGSEQRSSTDDSSIPENESKDVKGKNVGTESAALSSDCCFCQKGRSQSQPSSSKGATHDCQQKQPQQVDSRPKWGANRPTKRYTTQSEKDPHYSCRSSSQKRQSVGRQKREAVDPATTEEGSEDPEQAYKPQVRLKSKIDPPASTSNTPAANGNARNPTPRNKRQTSKKSSMKSNDAKRTSPQSIPSVSQTPLPVLTSSRTTAPRRVQVVKPSLSLDQDFLEQNDHHLLESSRIQSSYFSSNQLTHMPMLPDCKHMPLPVLPPLHQSRLSPIRITQTPLLAPIRISPTPPLRMYPTPIGQMRTSPSPTPSLNRYTQTPTPTTPAPEPPTPTSPTPTYQPPQKNRQCGSPPVPAVLSKMLREQAKSPPRQFSFISTAPHREEKPPPPLHSRKNSRANTPLLKPQTPSAKLPSPRIESKNAVVLITPSDEPAKNTPVLKAMAPAMPSPVRENPNSALLVTPRENMSIGSPSLNVSCHSPSSAGDNSNALMLVTMSEDISVGSPIANLPANNQMSMLEIDDNRSMGLITPSDEISVGLDSRSNFSTSRASQISNEGMPEGFWEDLGSSLQASSPLPDTSISESIPEHGNNEEKTNDVIVNESDRDKNTKVIGKKIDDSPKNLDPSYAEQKIKSEQKQKGRNEAGEITDPENGEMPVLNSLVGVHKTPKLERSDKIRRKSNIAAKEKTEIGEGKKTENQPFDEAKKDHHESDQDSDGDLKKTLVQRMENVYISQRNIKEKADTSEGVKTENQAFDEAKKDHHESDEDSDGDLKKNLVQRMENVYISQRNMKEKADTSEGVKTENQAFDEAKKDHHESDKDSDGDLKKNLVQRMENVYISQRNIKEKADTSEGVKTENQAFDEAKKDHHESDEDSDGDLKKNLVQRMENVYISQRNMKEKADTSEGVKTENQAFDEAKKDHHESDEDSDGDLKKNLVQRMENVYLSQRNVESRKNTSPKNEDKTNDEVISRDDGVSAGDVGPKKETVEVNVLTEGKHQSSEIESIKGDNADVSGQVDTELKEKVQLKDEDDVKKGIPSGTKDVVASGTKTGSAEELKTKEVKDSLTKSKEIKPEDDGNIQSSDQGLDVDNTSTQCLLPFLLPHYEGNKP